MISVLGAEKLSLVEIEAFLAASDSVRFTGCGRTEIYGWVERLLCHHQYPHLGRRAKGLLRAYIERMTGLSRAQSTRLIGGYVGSVGLPSSPPAGLVTSAAIPRPTSSCWPQSTRRTSGLSGPATRHILKREFEVYGKPEFERLARLSNGHLYNLRRTPRYGLRSYQKTRPTAVQIGERRKPAPNGQPGFLRIDTVHQGDGPEGKGIYHINAVDEVTQWQVVLATPRISEAWLLPLLECMLRQFPFVILNFHSDNGSEFINKIVAELLGKLLIEQTKSRPRRSGDNGLVETKNAAIVRKHIGWGHIAPAHAAPLNQFYTGFLNPYVNYHRPSAQAQVQIDAKGRKRRIYKQWQTPFEKLLSLDRPQQFLRPGLSLAALKRVAATSSDTEAARRMQQAKYTMFEQMRRSA
jgi:hypothetical protein